MEATVVVAELGLVEGLGLVELHAVQGSDLVSVSVSLSAPEGTIPVLTVACIAGREFTRLLIFCTVVGASPVLTVGWKEVSDLASSQFLHLQHFSVLKLNTGVTGAPVVLSLGCGGEVTGTESSGSVISWMTVRSTSNLGLSAKATGGSV